MVIGPNASGHGRDPGRTLFRRREIDVAAKLPFGVAVDADIDHDRAGLDPVALHEVRPAHTRDDDIALPDDSRQIPRLRVTDGHRAAFHQELERHRPADDVRLPDHDRMLAHEILAGVLQQRHATVGRTRTQRRPLEHQAADVIRMEAVDVLQRIDGFGDAFLGDLLRQRQLHQDAVDRRILIERSDERDELGFRRRRRQVVRERAHPGRVGRSPLVAHVDLRSGVVADQHHGEPGWRMAGRDARRHRLAHLRRQPLGPALAVDDARAHL